jgi:hypothetical protein
MCARAVYLVVKLHPMQVKLHPVLAGVMRRARETAVAAGTGAGGSPPPRGVTCTHITRTVDSAMRTLRILCSRGGTVRLHSG